MKNNALAEARLKTGHSQQAFARISGIPYNSYKAYELGNRCPSPERAKQMMNILKKYGVNCELELFYP